MLLTIIISFTFFIVTYIFIIVSHIVSNRLPYTQLSSPLASTIAQEGTTHPTTPITDHLSQATSTALTVTHIIPSINGMGITTTTQQLQKTIDTVQGRIEEVRLDMVVMWQLNDDP